MNQELSRRSDAKESGIVQRVRKSVRALPFNHPHVLLACSGGKDSVSLAVILAELKRLKLITLSIAHVHHGQHDLANAAAEAVAEIGSVLAVPYVLHKLDVAAIDSHEGVGLEEALRRERYRALASIAQQVGADCIAMAHHETDQAETVLLHLMRGSGVDGLAGMRPWEIRRIPWWTHDGVSTDIGIWRPLLDEKLADIVDIACDSALPIVEDPTNMDTSFRRNAVRQNLLPVIERIAPGSLSVIARTSDLVSEDAEYLDFQTNKELMHILKDGTLGRNQLVALPGSMQRRVVRAWINQSYPGVEVAFERIAAVLQLAERNRGGARIELGSGVAIELRNGRLEMDSWQNRGQ